MIQFASVQSVPAPAEPLKRAFYGDSDTFNLHIATNATDEEMEGTFVAWCLDEQEWLNVHGWNFDWVEDDGKRDDPMAERRALGETARD